MEKLYYIVPPDSQFNELKEKAIEVWQDCNEEYEGYTKEKTDQIERMENISDNFMYIVAMLDINQQRDLAQRLSPATKEAVRERIISGGSLPENYGF